MSIKPTKDQIVCYELEKEINMLIENETLPDQDYSYYNLNNTNFKSKGIYRLLIDNVEDEYYDVLLEHEFNLLFYVGKIWHTVKKEINQEYLEFSIERKSELKELYKSLMKEVN